MNAHRNAPLLLSLFCAAALLPAQTPLAYHGLELELPKGWKTQASDAVLLLTPAGWQPNQRTGEAYGLLFDAETKTLGGEDFEAAIDAAADAILEGATRRGPVGKAKVGALDGRVFAYELQNAEGQAIVMRIHVVAAKDGAVALFVLGFPDTLAARDAEYQRLLASLRPAGKKPKRRAFGMGGGDTGQTEAGTTEVPKPPRSAGVVAGDEGDADPDKAAMTTNTEKAADAPGPRPPGGKVTTWKSVQFDLPKGWTTRPGEDAAGTLLLMPPDFGRSGVLEEIYALAGDGSVRSLDADELADTIQEGLDEMQPGLMIDGEPKPMKFGSTKGKVFTFRGPSVTGQDLLCRVYAFPTADGVCVLLGLGFPEKVQSREPEVLAVLATMRKAKPGSTPGGAAEFAGQWVLFSNFNATNGGGRMSSTTLNLGSDGSYTYSAETSSSNPFGGSASSENDAGRWSVQGNSMVFRSNSGTTTTYRLQKRNHPKTNDPMLLLDDNAFVTATQRAPW